MAGFKKFLLRGNLVDLAVAVVIGAAFGAIVTALVKDMITPLVAAIFGKEDFGKLSFTLHKSKFMYGDFINSVVTFVMIATVVYFFVIIPVGKLMEHFRPTPDKPPATKECPHCLSKVPAAATVCASCTRDLTPSLALR